MTEKKFFVYEHWRSDKGVCFYVGKGTRRRPGDMAARNPHHRNIRNKLLSLGLNVEIRIVGSGLTEAQAFSLERERIGYWRTLGIPLCNKTDGGEGVSGYVMTPEQRKRLSEAHKGRIISAETRARMSAAQKGKIVSEEARRNMSEGQKNSVVPKEEKQRRGAILGKSHLGKKKSAETRARMAEAIRRSHRENPRSAEVHRKIGDAQRGVRRSPHSAETKLKMSIAAKRWRAARRVFRATSRW